MIGAAINPTRDQPTPQSAPVRLLPRAPWQLRRETGGTRVCSDAAQLEYGCVDWYMYGRSTDPNLPSPPDRRAHCGAPSADHDNDRAAADPH